MKVEGMPQKGEKGVEGENGIPRRKFLKGAAGFFLGAAAGAGVLSTEAVGQQRENTFQSELNDLVGTMQSFVEQNAARNKSQEKIDPSIGEFSFEGDSEKGDSYIIHLRKMVLNERFSMDLFKTEKTSGNVYVLNMATLKKENINGVDMFTITDGVISIVKTVNGKQERDTVKIEAGKVVIANFGSFDLDLKNPKNRDLSANFVSEFMSKFLASS